MFCVGKQLHLQGILIANSSCATRGRGKLLGQIKLQLKENMGTHNAFNTINAVETVVK